MSTNDAPTTELAANAPELITSLDEVEPAHEPSFQLDNRPRRAPEPDSPPRGASRDLGGRCPRCSAPMKTRLRAQYGNDGAAKVKLQGYCTNHDNCGFACHGFSETFLLEEWEV